MNDKVDSEYCDVSDAKIRWLTCHPELEASWLGVLAAEESGKVYYYNRDSQTSIWERPEGFEGGSNDEQRSGEGGGGAKKARSLSKRMISATI